MKLLLIALLMTTSVKAQQIYFVDHGNGFASAYIGNPLDASALVRDLFNNRIRI